MRYDFLCQSCEKVSEIQRRLDDETPVRCPDCGSTDVKKLFLSTSGIFVYWHRVLGLGHKGAIVIPAAVNRPLIESLKRRKNKHANELQQRTRCA